MTLCKKCGAPIFWRKTRGGKWMPLNEEPLAYEENPEGKEILFDLNCDAIRCDLVDKKPGEKLERIAYRSHWATCTFADDFRKKKGDDEE